MPYSKSSPRQKPFRNTISVKQSSEKQRQKKLDLSVEPEDSEVIKGSGIRAKVGGKIVAIGNRKLMDQEGIAIPEEIGNYAIEREKAGNTAIFASVDGEIVGIFSIADQIRDDAKHAL